MILTDEDIQNILLIGIANCPPPQTRLAGSPALRDVAAERRRQVEAEGWTPEHDDQHISGEMAWAAVCYVQNAAVAAKMLGLGILKPADVDERSASLPMPEIWPWSPEWWKPKSQRENLVRSTALIIAEIERLDRAATATEDGQ
jgi:hypothetical protein